MDHNRYGLDGLPLACRSAQTDPVTGLPLPEFSAHEGVTNEAARFVVPAIAGCMIVFALFFVYEAKVFG